jgi:hypothetical protein
MIFLLFDIAADFVLGSISNRLAMERRDIQQLIVQEQKKVEEQEALKQVPTSATVIRMSDGNENMTISSSFIFYLEVGMSGEIIRTYLQRIVDLTAAKNAYDMWKGYIDMLFETEVVLIIILSATGVRSIDLKKRVPAIAIWEKVF